MSKFDTALLAPIASPSLTGDPKAPTATPGDNDTSLATTAFVTNAVAGGTASPAGSGRLAYVSATALSFKPFNGDRIKINGQIYAIPSAGIAGLANTSVFVNGTGGQNLAGNTTYYVYAFNNSGTITADFSTTGHATSATSGNIGVEIKSGDDTRSLIGMIRTDASAQFVYTINQYLFVRTWFNDPGISAQRVIGGLVNGNTSFVQTTGEAIYFLTWAGESLDVEFIGNTSNTSGAVVNYMAVGIDSSQAGAIIAVSCTNAAYSYPWTAQHSIPACSEGYHTTAIFSRVSGGTGTIGPFNIIFSTCGSGV